MTRRVLRRPFRGVAAVELALLLPFLMVVIVGVWEVGRLVQVQQVLNNAAREGARLSAQGRIINKDSDPTEIQIHSGTPGVEATVKNYLREAGINTDNLQVDFAYLTGDLGKTEPYQGAKGQRFQVTVTLPFDNVRWTMLSLSGTQTLRAAVIWQSLVDDPFTLDTSLPNW